MILDYLMLLNALAAAPAAPAASPPPLAATAVYTSRDRSVDGWRIEGAFALDLKTKAAWELALGAETSPPPRCVRLNNYWCVKHAGWRGEIATDPDNHAVFATPHDGAAAAAMLLRRYYLEFKRHTAREIAARWAPAQCFETAGATAAIPLGAPIKPNLSRMLPQRPLPMGLAPHGLGNTLRGRWLAARRGLGGGRGLKQSRVRDEALEMAPAPEIAVGMGEAPRKRPSPAPRPTPPPAASVVAPAAPLAECADENLRVSNYAAHIAQGVVATPDQDLALFTPDGAPTANFEKVLINMAAVEIGPLRANPLLVGDAVARLRGERLATGAK